MLAACAMLGWWGVTPAHAGDPASFPQPNARCVRPEPGRVVTSVGRFAARGGGWEEVVADTRLDPEPGEQLPFGHPSISIFDAQCRRVWYQTFVEDDARFSEVGFKVLTLPGGTRVLYVLAITVFQPGDGTIAIGELLASRPRGTRVIGPRFHGYRHDTFYLGPIHAGREFGIYQGSVNYGPAPERADILTGKLYRWTRSPGRTRPGRSPGYHFAAPERLDAAAATALELLALPPQPRFPLCDFWWNGAMRCGPVM